MNKSPCLNGHRDHVMFRTWVRFLRLMGKYFPVFHKKQHLGNLVFLAGAVSPLSLFLSG